MPDAHVHSHPHEHAHEPLGPRTPVLRPSWLRHSALQRLAGAGVGIALIWAGVFWALQ